jgi:predicted MPP superfamily phosphohydrolase
MQISRRRFLKTGGIFAAGTGLVGLSGGLYGTQVETRLLELESIQIPIEGLPGNLEGFRIILMSDFHISNRNPLEFMEEAISMAASLPTPDLIALTGDYVLRDVEAIFDLAPALERLNSKHGTFCVLGNHDLWQGAPIIHQAFKESGLEILVNRGVTLAHNNAPFFLAGVDDGWAGYPDLDKALESRPQETPVILLAHEPDLVDDFAPGGRVMLQLSGHSHGGQVRFPGLGSPFCPPFGRKYDMGLYKVENTLLYTNRGIGVTAPIRLNCRPEITEITRVNGSQKPGAGS